ncbi:ester cyclase [Streptomyces vinaceus]|uniref:ester cyclase n=1 Tax=Streptomyces vinaceus TaxID=1960 RepID=UPI00369CDF8D
MLLRAQELRRSRVQDRPRRVVGHGPLLDQRQDLVLPPLLTRPGSRSCSRGSDRADRQRFFGVGNKVTVLLHFGGTHRGAYQQSEATGRRVGFGGIEGDEIAGEWVAPDVTSRMRQISPDAGH